MFLLLLVASFSIAEGFHETEDNQGWPNFLADEPTHFMDLDLTWSLNQSIPSWLQGSYIKNGPAQIKFGTDRQYANLIDGWGKLHKLTFTNGKVKFSGRMIETANYKKCAERDDLVPTVTLDAVQPNDWSLLELYEAMQNGMDNTNIVLWKIGPANKEIGEYIALTDMSSAHKIDPDTLAVMELLEVPDGIAIGSSCHWRREVGRNSSLNFQIYPDLMHLAYQFTLSRTGNTWQDMSTVATFPISYLPLLHMISNTKHYAVIVLYPVSVDYFNMFAHNMHPLHAIKKLDQPCRIYLVDLRDGTVIDGFESRDPSLVYATHHINAFEDGEDEVVVDLNTNPWSSLKDFTNLETMLNHEDTHAQAADTLVKRVRLNLNTKAVMVEEYANEQNIPYINTIDFPTINPEYVGIKHRYVYGWASMDYWRQVLVKKDLEDSRNDKTWTQKSHYSGEPLFVPNPDGVAEDDGILITIVYDGPNRQSYLMLMDAKSFQVLNYAYLPYHVPFSTHGMWFPELY